jgi:predicted amidohydrolase
MPAERRPFRIGLVQMRCGPDPEENLARAAARVGEAASAGESGLGFLVRTCPEERLS